MSRALIISFGGSIEPIVVSIAEHQPSLVVFFASEKTIESIGDIKARLHKSSITIDGNRNVMIDDAEDLEACYVSALRCAEIALEGGRSSVDVVVDFTGGTKAMTAALTLATVGKGFAFSYVGGSERSKQGRGVVTTGSERIVRGRDPFALYAVHERRRLAQYFNHYQFQAAPHPFVFEPPAGGITAPAGRPLAVGMTLFGKAIGSLSHFIFALEQLGQGGLGARRVRCTLSSVDSWLQGRPWTLYNADDRVPRSADAFEQTLVLLLRPDEAAFENRPTERVTIEFQTPLRVRYDSRLASELPFHVLFRNLLRRISHLSYFHCGGDPSGLAFREWIDLALRVETVEHDLKWFNWERYSNRQQTAMSMGGLIGHVTYEGDLAPFYPFLKAGEIIHAGKGTSFGLGRFRIVPGG